MGWQLVTGASVNAAPALTTMGRTVLVGPRDAANGGYATLQRGQGEPHLVRTEMTGRVSPVTFAITSFAQMADLHIVDDQSPLRVEFLDRYANPGEPHEASWPFSAAYRPNECLSTQVLDAMCRALNNIGRAPRTGLPLGFTMISGDGVDNAQFNELRLFIDVLDGQAITPNSGASFDHSVTGDSLGLDINYWHPGNRDFELSNKQGPGLDLFFQAGFPSITQLPGVARHPFTPVGLQMPWFAVIGNHDALVQGNAAIDGTVFGLDIGDFLGISLKDIAVGTFKRSNIAEPLPDKYTGDPFDITGLVKLAIFQDFAGVLVPADPLRRLVGIKEFIAELFDTQGTPAGHGFDLQSDVSWYAMVDPHNDLVRHIVLDTVNFDGGARGDFSSTQANFLEQQLKANSSVFFNSEDPPALIEQPGIDDKLFVIHSHHSLRTMDNAEPLLKILLRFPNVILHVNGHNHKNEILAHERPWFGPPGGFWEINTASQIDWPMQSRIIEIAAGGGFISIFTTMVDIDAPLDWRPGDIHDPNTLAALSRELAANDLQQRASGVLNRPGKVGDRNAQLVMPAPFPLPDPVTFGSAIAATRRTGDHVLLFGTSSDDLIFRGRLVTGGVMLSQIDGALRCLCVETNADGRAEIFGINRAGTPFHRAQTSAGSDSFAPWIQLPGQFTAIAAARNSDGRIEVFTTNLFESGIDSPPGPLRHSVQLAPDSTELSDWTFLDDGSIGFVQLAAATNSDGRIALFGITSTASTVLYRVQSSPGNWAGSSWILLDGSATAIAAGCGPDNVIALLITDEDGRVQQRRQTAPGASTWSDWEQLDDDWAQFPIRQIALGSRGTAVTQFQLGLMLFGLDTEGGLWVRSQAIGDPSAWTPWTALNATLRSSVLPTTVPQATSPGDQTSLLGMPVDLRLASSGGVDPVTWAFSGLPPGLSGDLGGHITGAAAASGFGVHPVSATVTDANLASSTVSFTWTTLTTVPDVTDSTREQAAAALMQAHLTLGTESLDNQCIAEAGLVVAQQRAAGSQVPEGSGVGIRVSSGVDSHGHKCGVLK
jgi:metallophosphoesterase (TIGR03767 family)